MFRLLARLGWRDVVCLAAVHIGSIGDEGHPWPISSQELKRRHIYRLAAAYVVVAWVLLQLFNNLEPILKLPDWAVPNGRRVRLRIRVPRVLT
jgi:hypothetical protein